jgi:hypothetical protein
LVAEGKKLGVFRSESAQLPIGTSFAAEITSPSSASVIITSTQGNQLKVGQMKKYAFPNQEWKGEDGVITIKVSGTGKAITPVALVDDKPLGVIDFESFHLLSKKLNARGIKIDRFKFQGTLESAPATITNIKVDPETIRYPQVWTRKETLVRDNKVSLLDELKPILHEKYQQKNNQGLLHDEDSSLGVVPVKSEYFQVFLEEKGKNTEYFKKLSDEIEKKFCVESLIGIARKGNIEELYFCVTVPTEASQRQTAVRINDSLNFPALYDQLENGRRTKFIAIGLDELQGVISQAEGKIKQSATQQTEIKAADEKVSDRESPVSSVGGSHSLPEYRIGTSTADMSASEPVKREEWEKQMLKLALASLKANPANAGEEMQTATFGDAKYRVIYHTPSEMLRIVDEEGVSEADRRYRGTLYKVQRGKLVQVCKFSLDEKQSFENEVKQQQFKGLQQE